MYSTQDDVSLCDVCEDCTSCKPRTTGDGTTGDGTTGDGTRVFSLSHLLMLSLAALLYHIY